MIDDYVKRLEESNEKLQALINRKHKLLPYWTKETSVVEIGGSYIYYIHWLGSNSIAELRTSNTNKNEYYYRNFLLKYDRYNKILAPSLDYAKETVEMDIYE